MRTPAAYTRAARRLVALLTVVSLLTPLAAARGADTCGTRSGPWTTIAGPGFSAGPQRIVDLAIDARTPSRFFVTNGTSVMRTSNGGCSWESVFELGPQPADGQTYTAANARILNVVVPESGGRVLLSIAETVVNQTRPHVLFSSNAGQSWQSGDAGLPPLGSPEALVVASSSPDTAYLAVDLSGGTLDSLYASADGGRSWQPRSQQLGSGITGFEVDPIVPNELWAYGSSGLYRSTDGGATFVLVDDFAQTQTGPVDVFHASGRPSSIFAFVPALRTVKRSQDGGQNWLDGYGLVDPDSIDHGVAAESRVATSDGKVYMWAPVLFTWVDARAPVGGLTGASATRSATPSFYFHNASQVVVYSGQTGIDYDIPNTEFVIGDISLVDPPPFVTEPPALSPKEETVRIPAGEKKRVTYDLSLSKVRTPLDLYFVIDTSESALPFLRGLAYRLQELVDELTLARLDVRFGLAEYRAYPDSTPPRPYCGDDDVPVVEDPQCERNFVYRQVLDLPGSSLPALEEAIESLAPVAGGHYDASLPALYQAATGAGEDVWPQGTTDSHIDGHDVPPGQQASFDERALKLVLIATDEGFVNKPYGSDDFPPDPPSFEQVYEALNARGIKQVGLALGSEATQDMENVARNTGAVAPAQGADCNGDGVAEIGPGEPLVCTVYRDTLEQGANLVPAIVNMVEAVRNNESVGFDVQARDDRVVASVTPEEYPGVALTADQKLKFSVTYECPMSMAGDRVPVDLVASQGPKRLDRATATVVCGKLDPKKKSFFDLFPFDRVFALLPLLPLSPPPTLTNPSQATQAQSQAQAQGAMATQEQEQPQVALATQYKSALKEALARDEEYAMTRYRDRTAADLPPGLFLGAAALMTAAAYGVAVSRRRRTALAPVRTRRHLPYSKR